MNNEYFSRLKFRRAPADPQAAAATPAERAANTETAWAGPRNRVIDAPPPAPPVLPLQTPLPPPGLRSLEEVKQGVAAQPHMAQQHYGYLWSPASAPQQSPLRALSAMQQLPTASPLAQVGNMPAAPAQPQVNYAAPRMNFGPAPAVRPSFAVQYDPRAGMQALQQMAGMYNQPR